jgi:hypothetical protein
MILGYDDMLLNRDGSVKTQQRIREERERRGYCTECRRQGEPPVLLFSIKKNRFNPLWNSKVPLTVKGESLNGQCLKCHPHLDPDRKSRNRRHTTSASRHSATATDHTSRPLRSSMDERTGQPTPRDQRYGQGRIERNPPEQQIQDARRGDRSEEENTDQIITATVCWARNGAMPSMSSSSQPLGDNASQEDSLASSTAPSSEAPRRLPLASSLFNSPSAEAAMSVPQITRTDEQSVASSASNRLSDESSSTSSSRHDSDRLARSMQIDQELPERDGDHAEIMYDRLRRLSSVRPVRQSSVANLMPPPADSSPVLSHLLRRAVATANANHDTSHPATSVEDRHSISSAGSDSASRLLSVASSTSTRSRLIPTDTLNDRLARNLDVPPDDDQSESPSTEASASPLTRSPPPTPTNEQAIVEDLGTLIRDLHRDGSYDLAVDVLLAALGGSAACPRVHQFCLAAIWDLGKDSDQFRASIMASSAPDDILLCMKQNLDNASIQEQACGALWALSIDRKNREIIIQAGATARVIKCITDHQSNESVIRAAMGCLRTLSPEPEVRVSTGVLDGVKHVCAAMRRNRSVVAIQVDGCAFLSNVAVDLDKQMVALATDEEIEVIVGAIVAHPTDLAVTAGACFALKNYTYDERNLRKLMHIVGIVPTLQGVVAQESELGSRCHAAGLLERFDAFVEEDALLEEQIVNSLEESIVHTLHSDDSVHRVLDVIADYDWSTAVTATGLRCLVTLISQRPSNRHLITEEVLENVVATMTKMMFEASVVTQGCEFLELFTRDRQSLRWAIVEAGACMTILQAMMLHVKDVVLQRAATGVLRFLSSNWKCRLQIHRHGLDSLNSVLAECSKDPTVHQNVSVIKENVSDMLDSSSA